MDNLSGFYRDNVWNAPGRTPKTPHPKTQAPRGSIDGTPTDRQEWQEFGVMPHSCRKWIYRTAKVRSNDQAGLCGARAPGHAGIYLTGSLRSPLPGRGGPGAPRVYGQTRAEVLIGLPAAAPRRRNEWAPARSSHGARIKKVRRRSSAGGACPGVIARSRSFCWRRRPARSQTVGPPPHSFLAAGSHRPPGLGAEAAPLPAGPAARGRRSEASETADTKSRTGSGREARHAEAFKGRA